VATQNRVDLWALSDLSTPWCLHVVATLRVAEHIVAGVTKIGDLATASGAHPDSLHRVLRHLISKGVFEEPVPGHFALNEAARQLLDSSLHLCLDLEGVGGRMAHAWSSLPRAVRTGAPAYHEIFGHPFWADLQAHPDIDASFDALMGPAGHGPPDSDVLVSGDWESVHTVVDVGGGTGALLAEILRTRPGLRGILVDRSATVARSAEIFHEACVTERAATVAQSFFDPLPSGADLYLLKSVLSDWPDHEAELILRRCAEAARPAGRVLILNGVFPDEEGVPSPSLLMMVLVGGKDRSLGQFRSLALAAGLEVHAFERKPSGRLVVECRPIN
jgi:2,7-dihydroxy-5-methyl-1-naphthoate 7-O-methyltransferase